MKKLTFFIVCAACLSLPSFAQLKVGIEAGMNLTHFRGNPNYSDKAGGMGAGIQVGGSIGYEFPKHWMLLSGVSFMRTQSNMKLTYNTLPYFPKAEIRLNRVVIPLKVGYHFRINEKVSLIPSIGIYGSYNFSAGKCALNINSPIDGKENIEQVKWNPMEGYTYSIPVTNSSEQYDVRLDALRHWTYGGTVGLKAVIHKHYALSFHYHEAMKSIQGACDIRDYGLQFSIGYLF